MTHGFYVVSIRISNERRKVVRVIVGPNLRLIEDVSTGPDRCDEKRLNRPPVIGDECNVGFSESFSGPSRTEPEHRVIDTEADSRVGVDEAAAAQRRQHRVIESCADVWVTALKSDVIKHGANWNTAG
jgi:hypothetical protein